MKNEIQAPAYVIKWKSSDGAIFASEAETVSKFRTELHEEIRHFERGFHRLAALVTATRCRTLQCLLHRFSRQHTE